MTGTTEHLVIGGGIVGVSVAEALAREGAQVTVIDGGGLGKGCSEGNAGWVTPCFAMPLPRPGLFWTSLRWMADANSPFYMQPRPTPTRLRWLLTFGLSMGYGTFHRGTGPLVELSRYSLDAYSALDRDSPERMGLQKRGLLMLALTARGAEAAGADAELLSGFGVQGRRLDQAGAREVEPALTGNLAGAVFYPDEAHLQPLATVDAIVEKARGLGVVFQENTEAFDFEVVDGRIRSVLTTRGRITPRTVTLATGAWSQNVGRRLGLRIPILGGKGYSMMVDAPEPAPRIPMMVLERKVAITPYGRELRLAGTLELVDGDLSISPRRVESIRRGAEAVLPLSPAAPSDRLWRGLRPCSPDGLPIIGRAPAFENVYIATGHQMLGIQTAPATGRLLADLILGREPTFDPAPFRPERFQ